MRYMFLAIMLAASPALAEGNAKWTVTMPQEEWNKLYSWIGGHSYSDVMQAGSVLNEITRQIQEQTKPQGPQHSSVGDRPQEDATKAAEQKKTEPKK